MDLALRDRFLTLWSRYFGASELPIALRYGDEPVGEPAPGADPAMRCIIGQLAQVRAGKTLSYSRDSSVCFGGQKYLGYRTGFMPSFPYFLSCGIPGKMEGERYRKTPELAQQTVEGMQPFEAPRPFAIFKRWDTLDEVDHPEVIVFFAPPDVLSGLFTLANYDRPDFHGVVAPFGSGCAAIVQYPYQQRDAQQPVAILGMFDVSARPHVQPGVLTFAVPFERLVTMIDNMDESFLITESWQRIHERIG